MGLASEEKFGVKVFDGAKYDAEVSQFFRTAMSMDAACYRTTATAAQVNEFYKKQPGMKEVHTFAGVGVFQKGEATITVLGPWVNMKSNERMKDTLIEIVKSPCVSSK